MTEKEIQEAHEKYLNFEINEYELADLLEVPYMEIGTYIMVTLPRRMNRVRNMIKSNI